MGLDIERLVRDIVQSYLEETNLGSAIPVGVSNRHVHLSEQHFKVLFGKNHQAKTMRELKQPGQHALQETVMLVGNKGVIENVRILGPVRSKTQVEVLAADCYKLGIPTAIRDSGDLAGSPGLLLVGPKGVVHLEEGAIVARRHIHANPGVAQALGLEDGKVVQVVVNSERSLVFQNVIVRVDPSYVLELHVDLEEANAAKLRNGDLVSLY